MKTTSTTTDPDAYLAALDDVRRPQLVALDARIMGVASSLDRRVQSGMLAYGHYGYRYASGREGTWFPIGLASNKGYISLYFATVDIAPFLARLPKANLGRGCIRFKRIADINLEVIDEIVRASAANDGRRIVQGA